jgi:glycine cleavage system regulatory protein
MSLPLVFTAIGADRPGLVELLSSAVAEHGGNWVDAKMSRLAGQFAGIVRVDVEAGAAGKLVSALEALSEQGLQVVVARSGDVAEREGEAFSLDVVGHDHSGIVRDIAAVVARHGANVETFTSEVVSAPMTGEPMFQAKAALWLPPSADADQLTSDLEGLAADLMVEISVAR